jgi:O-antigen/teichoic acid export membrane protein
VITKSVEKVAKGSTLLTIDTIVTALFGGFFWIIAAKFINTLQLGMASTAISFITLLAVFANLGLHIGSSRYIAEYNAVGMPLLSRRVARLSLEWCLAAGVVLGLGIALFSNIIARQVYSTGELTSFFVIVGVSIPLQGLVTVLDGIYRGAQRMDLMLYADSVEAIAKFGFACIVVLLGFQGVGVVSAYLVSYVASLLLALPFWRRAMPRISVEHEDRVTPESQGLTRRLLTFSMPNYAAVTATSLSNQFTVILLGVYTLIGVAYYNIAMLIVTVGLSGIATAVNFALLPTATEEWVKGNLRGLGVLYNRITRLLLLASGPLIIVGVIFPSTILRLISPSFVAASNAFRVLAFAGLLNGIGAPAIGVVNAMNRAKTVMIIYLTAVVMSLAISLAFIPILGMVGAGIAYTTPTLVIALLSVLYLRSQRISLELSSMGRPFIFIFASMLLGFLSIRIVGIAQSLLLTLILYSFAVIFLGGLRHEDFELISQMAKGKMSLSGSTARTTR